MVGIGACSPIREVDRPAAVLVEATTSIDTVMPSTDRVPDF
jgi:hypothetical protein